MKDNKKAKNNQTLEQETKTYCQVASVFGAVAAVLGLVGMVISGVKKKQYAEEAIRRSDEMMKEMQN